MNQSIKKLKFTGRNNYDTTHILFGNQEVNILFGWRKKSTKTIMDQAKENLANRPLFVAKQLIELVDADLLKNTKKGYSYGSVFHQRYDVKVDKEVLDLMEEHYLKQGFEVEIDYPSNIGSNSLKSFTIRI